MFRPGEAITVLGHATRLRGDLECQGDLQIEGEFEGSIRQHGGRVTIGTEAHVIAQIVAQDVVVMGHVEGDLRATGRVDLRSTAVVTGDVFAARLSMEENATLHGQVDPSRVSEDVDVRHEVAYPVESAPVSPTTAREPEHRQALPLREESSSRYRVAPSEPVTQERQLPSALAAFAPGGRKDLSERTAGVARTRHENSWHQRDRE